MAQEKLYLRPGGLLWGSAAQSAIKTGIAGPLAPAAKGESFAAWSMAEVIERTVAGISRRWVARHDLITSSDAVIIDLISAIEAPRPAITKSPLVMGIVNVTSDSFSDGGLYESADAAIEHGRVLTNQGADILDIGGESTRPGSTGIDDQQELERVTPVIKALKNDGHMVSVDTRKACVMQAAADNGADFINDVSALRHDAMSAETAAKTGLPVILMHAQGDPENMQKNPHYDDVALDVYDQLEAIVANSMTAGIARDRLVIDPGIGFGKTFDHNLRLLSHISMLHGLGLPVLIGASRKGFIGTLTNEPQAENRVAGSLATVIAAVEQGVHIVRVHDVRETAQILQVWQASHI